MDFLIQKEHHGMMLRHFLQKELRLSTKMMKHIKFCEDGILVNGIRVTVRYTLSEGELLSLALEDRETAPIKPVDLPLDILYEDDDLVIPAKPADMPTHPSHDHHEDTVANALAYRYARNGEPFVFRPVNRLDRNTSGLLLIARNRPSAGRLAQEMRSGGIQKTYLAVLDGEWAQDSGVIDACLHRTAESIIVREVCSPDAPDADTARTEFRVLARGNGHTLVEAHPITGRTHQLRVHFAYSGHPITGDDLYGKASPEIARHALHAYSCTFLHPTRGEKMTVVAPIPTDFERLLTLWFPSDRLPALERRTT